MKKLVVGMLAHVDAGKTTLSEAMLYMSGNLRKLGRVDHGDAFLDTDIQERERGITIFSKQAVMSFNETRIILLDTPGHVDFSAEMERTLQVLDCAVLVISGTDGIQGHTLTLWKLLERYHVPVFIFVNKMDLNCAGRDVLLKQLRHRLSVGCLDFSGGVSGNYEDIAMCSEEVLEEFIETDAISQKHIAGLIAQRKVFPCWFGSALKLKNVEELIAGLETYAEPPIYNQEFGAKVFKISRDNKNVRLTWMKITGGVLRAKTAIDYGNDEDMEKADQLRFYSGEKFQIVEEACAGDIVAVTGLTHTYPGQGIGCETDAAGAELEPVLNYRMILPDGVDPHNILPKLRLLEDEDPMLRIVWNERLKEIHVKLMGQVQLEVLRRLIQDRFGIDVDFGVGNIVYKETILGPVEGIGHFEPLRHYAEVHLLMEPGERGSGLHVASDCSTDQLDVNWQRLILTHLLERKHPGVLTGSDITDMKITLVAGRAHLKHTEGGDFRQATYRAVRQGLMQADTILLEPFYDFRIELPMECVGRAISDIQGMGGTINDPESDDEMSVLTGFAPVAGLQDYWQEVAAYTRGLGRLFCTLRGYDKCHDAEDVAAAIGYDPEKDIDNPADSVFCEHGGGITVKWDQVHERMHVDSGLRLGAESEFEEIPVSGGRSVCYSGSVEQDKELQAIYERTYGKVERRAFRPQPKAARTDLDVTFSPPEQPKGPEYLLVDGYNIIFAWDGLKDLARHELSAARAALEEILINYQGFRKCVVILVFDAYKVKGNPGSVEKHNGIYVVYTKEAETADNYIERATYKLGKDYRVRVATSDGLEQVIILGHGALRVSAEMFKAEVVESNVQIAQLIAGYNRSSNDMWKIKNVAKYKNIKNNRIKDK